jgi:hypothetical protein
MSLVGINFDDLTIGDLEDIEEITGKLIEDINWDKPPKKAIVALVYVFERKKNPDFTITDARAYKPEDLSAQTNPTQDGDAT